MKQSTRREFLSRTILGAVGAGIALRTLDSDLLAFAQPDLRAYKAARYGIFLDGASAGWLESVEGGQAAPEPGVSQKFGLAPAQKEALTGAAKPQEITLSCGIGMSQAFYQWIKASFDSQPVRKSGAISMCDYDYKEHSRMEFLNAVINEVGFPALDGSSKDPAARMTIKLMPESTRMTTNPAGATSASGGVLNKGAALQMQKKWLPSNFRLKIDGLDCSHVETIEALTIKQQSAQTTYGALRTTSTAVGSAQTRRLVFTMPERDSTALSSWRQSLLVSGGTVAGKKNGQLEFLTTDKSEALFTLIFRNLALIKITAGSLTASATAMKPLTAEISYEEIKFDYGNAWA